MAQLTKERDHLFETIRTYRLLFETTRQLINEMQGTVPARRAGYELFFEGGG